MSEPLSPPPPAPPGAGGVPPVRSALPWETSKGLGALGETIKLLITSPGRAFAMARLRDDYLSPLLFAIILALLGSIMGSFWSLVLRGLGIGGDAAEMERQLDQLPAEWREIFDPLIDLAVQTSGPASIVLWVVLSPLLAIIGLFIYSAVVHLGLKLVKGLRDSSSGFEGTFRSAGYSMTSNLAMVVPFAGWILSMLWGFVLMTFGLSELHRTSRGKALFGALFPLLLCCLCCCAVWLVALTMGAVGAGMLDAN